MSAETYRPGPATKLVFTMVAFALVLGLFGFKIYEATILRDLQDQNLRAQMEEMAAQMFLPEPARGDAPLFALAEKNGKTHSLAGYRGKWVLLSFWASWCPPCVEEMPAFIALTGKLHQAGKVAVVTISNDDGWEAIDRLWQTRFQGREPPFPVLLDADGQVTRRYGTVKFPETYVIDPQGKLAAKFVGPRDWRSPHAARYFDGLIAGTPAVENGG